MTRRMRILVASHQWFPDYTGGSARVATETAYGLARRGHEVTALVPRSLGHPDRAEESGVVVRRLLPTSVLPRTLTDVSGTWRHTRGYPKQAFDVLLAHHPTTAAGLLHSGLEAPLAFVYHASILRELRMVRTTLAPGFRRLAANAVDPPLQLLERATVARAARVIVLSDHSRALVEGDYRRLDRGLVQRAPGGVDTSFFAPHRDREKLRHRLGIRPGSRVVLTARRLDPCLGLETVVEAVRHIGASPPVELCVAGEGPLRGTLERLGSQLGLADRVRFLGVPSPSVLRDWYSAADVFVISPAPHEGFGMVTLEALSTGTPVVGAPFGATPELLRPLEPGLVAPGGDARSFGETIRRTLMESDEDLRLRCREYAERHYGWDVVIPAWERILDGMRATQADARCGR